ncbi:hypothetical protein F4825DRAFT_391399 [Nemania diffusa]|nr:hypothetical protein F4825DRAFT_391399 [Nemania diffusa]
MCLFYCSGMKSSLKTPLLIIIMSLMDALGPKLAMLHSAPLLIPRCMPHVSETNPSAYSNHINASKMHRSMGRMPR